MIYPNFKNEDLKFFIKNFFYVSFSKIFILCIGFLTSIVWANFTAPEFYGKYLLLISFIPMAQALSFNGYATTAQISSSKKFDGNLILILKKKILLSTIGSSALLIISLFYLIFKNDFQLFVLCIILSIFFPLVNINDIWESWINARKDFLKISILQVIISLVNFLSISVTLFFSKSLFFVIPLLFFLQSFLNILVIIHLLRSYNNNNLYDVSLLDYGYKLSLVLMLPMFVLSFERFIIAEFLTFKEVAIFSIAFIFPNILVLFYGIINRMITPYITEAKNVKEAWNFLKNYMYLITCFFFILAIVGYFSLNFLITNLYSDNYLKSIPLAQTLWFFCSISCPVVFMGSILRAQKVLSFSKYWENINAYGKISLGILLTYYFDLWGFVYAYCFFYILSIVFFSSYLYKELNKN